MAIGPLPTIEIVNPEDPEGRLVINKADFDPAQHEVFDPLAAQSAKAKAMNADAAKAKAEPEPNVEPAPKPKPKPRKRAAKKAVKK